MLTGNVSKVWKLAPGDNDKAITVGNEANPSIRYPGGRLDACQLDDTYTFFADGTITYNANGKTFNGGNIALNFTCGIDRTYTKKTFTYNNLANGVAGNFQFTLAGNPDASLNSTFIGVTDVANNTYRVISITDNTFVLRTTNGTNPDAEIHQFKFIAQ